MAAIVNERTQYLDAAGKPFVGGFVFIGDQNADPEVSPKDIFSDRELTLQLTQPVELDGFGRAEFKIWTDGRYSLRVRDVDLAQVLLDEDRGEEASTGITSLDNVAGANTITAEAATTITALVDLQQYIFPVALDNTDAVTLNIDESGATDVVKNVGEALEEGDFIADQRIVAVYNATEDYFQWVNINTEEQVLPNGYLAGGILLLNALPTDTVEIEAGSARDSTDTFDMTLTAFTKDMSAAWVVGAANGGLFTGSLSAIGAYDVYAILLASDGVTVDYGCDLVANGTTNLPAGYTNFRVLGRFYTDVNAAILSEIFSTNDRGFPPAYSVGGAMSIGFNATTTAISGVTAGTNGPRFAFVAGPTNLPGDIVQISGFTVNPDYNGTFRVGAVGAAFFEVNELDFGTGESGVFAERDFNLIDTTTFAGRDDLNVSDMISGAITKDISATWAVGDGNGGLFTGTVAADTVYFYFAIERISDGVIDYGFDTDIGAANIPTGYTNFKLLSRLLTDSGSLLIDSMQGVFEESYALTPTQNTVLAHGLAVVPDFVKYELVILVADGGYVVGDVVPISPQYAGNDVSAGGFAPIFDSVEIDVETIGLAFIIRLLSRTANDFTVNIGTGDVLMRVTARTL